MGEYEIRPISYSQRSLACALPDRMVYCQKPIRYQILIQRRG